jgi:undecaprenyl-diphosphatase
MHDMATVVSMSSVTASVFGGFDRWVWRQSVEHPLLTDFAKNITDAGVMSVLLPLAAVAGVLLWWRYRSLLIAVVPWCALQLNSSLVAVMKRGFDIARPPKEFWLSGAGAGSFPSGHAANTTCLLVAIAGIVFLCEPAPEIKRAAVVIAAVGSVVMGWTRIALNVHWLSDVLAGFFVGTCVAAAVVSAAVLLRSRRAIPLQTHDQSAS